MVVNILGRHKKYDRTLAVDKGVPLLRKNGYHNTSAADIVDSIAIPKGTFFGMFKTKEDFGLEVLQQYIDNSLDFMELHLYGNKGISAGKRLQMFYGAVSQCYIDEGCAHGCLLNNLTSEVAGYNDAFSRLAQRGHALIIDKLEPCVEEAQEKGDFRSDIDSYELTYFIHTSFDGAVLKMKGERNEKALKIFMKTIFQLIRK